MQKSLSCESELIVSSLLACSMAFDSDNDQIDNENNADNDNTESYSKTNRQTKHESTVYTQQHSTQLSQLLKVG